MGKPRKDRFKNNMEISSYNDRKFKEFKRINSENIVDIPVDKIKLLSQIHIDGLRRNDMSRHINYYKTNELSIGSVVIVQPDKDGSGNYNLITGWRTYVIADGIGQDTVKAIVVNCSRKELKKMLGCVVPYNYVSTDELKVTDKFSKSTVSSEKLNTIREYDEKCHQPYKPIVVDANGYIIDGYAQYVYNKAAGIKMSQVIRKQIELDVAV
ncbi:hypothetical protein DS742_14315 [Lacrimispora amygdalina]|uniref:ParB/Sulfiredoxin domain-containing protein n=1 Tax=Lacrimispora amygdalina TaxID=253257 RepID=A0A3E2NBE1_9FIRM|nr:hypothetical protein [Clostridium indicum]RFZ78284.1 hypothetical protein DS742_14315 [Clostridium indicum]